MDREHTATDGGTPDPAAPSSSSDDLGPDQDPDRTIDLAELLVLVGAATVAAVASSGLVLANADLFDARLALLVGALVPVAAGAAVLRRALTLRVTWQGLAVVALAGALGAALLLPGFPYLVGDKDPGIYAAHALAIDRTGGTAIDDPILAADLAEPYLSTHVDALFPGYWVDDHDPAQVRPQFFHLLPSLLATASSAGGERGLFNLVPVLAALAAATIGLAVRRVAGTLAGALAVTLLLVNLMQAWHSRHPSTEVLTQLFAAGAGLSLIVAVRARVPWLAGVAGLLVATAFLARPDGLLLVVIGIGAAAVVLGLGRGGATPWWFLGGLAIGLPYPLFQAYHLNSRYMLANDMPDWPLVAAGAVAATIGAVVLRRFVAPKQTDLLDRARQTVGDRDLRAVAAAVAGAVAAAGLVLAWFRPDLFDLVTATTLDGTVIQRLDEYNLRKLAELFTIPGLVAMWVGLVVLVGRRTLAALWLLVLPGVLLFPLYVWQAHIESRLMWWSRRFVPVIIPAVVVLIAVALAAALLYRGRRQLLVRGAGAAVAAWAIVVPLTQTLDVRSHREFGGSVELIDQIASVAGGEEALFLWEFPRPGDPFDVSRVLAGPVWFAEGHLSSLLPADADAFDIKAHLAAFPDHEVFLIGRGDTLPEAAEEYQPTPVLRVQTALSHWSEDELHVPVGSLDIPFDLTVWAVQP